MDEVIRYGVTLDTARPSPRRGEWRSVSTGSRSASRSLRRPRRGHAKRPTAYALRSAVIAPRSRAHTQQRGAPGEHLRARRSKLREQAEAARPPPPDAGRPVSDGRATPRGKMPTGARSSGRRRPSQRPSRPACVPPELRRPRHLPTRRGRRTHPRSQHPRSPSSRGGSATLDRRRVRSGVQSVISKRPEARALTGYRQQFTGGRTGAGQAVGLRPAGGLTAAGEVVGAVAGDGAERETEAGLATASGSEKGPRSPSADQALRQRDSLRGRR